jgi:hypothetical protein
MSFEFRPWLLYAGCRKFSDLREVQRKALNHPVDDTIFARRIRTKILCQALEQGQQLSSHDIDDRLVAQKDSSPCTLDRHIVVADQFVRNRLAQDDFHESEFSLVQFPKHIGFVSSQHRIRGQKAHHQSVFIYLAHWAVSKPEIDLTHGADGELQVAYGA